MKIYDDFGFSDLVNKCWSGASDTLQTIQDNDKEDEFMDYLQEVFCDDIPSLTQVNDFLWFESDTIYQNLNITENEENEEEEEEGEENE